MWNFLPVLQIFSPFGRMLDVALSFVIAVVVTPYTSMYLLYLLKP